MWFDLSVIASFLGVIWYAFESLRAREIATAVTREYCRQSDLQLLDGTVSLKSVSLASISVHHWRPKLVLRRYYEFHYTNPDDEKLSGAIVLLGQDVDAFILS